MTGSTGFENTWVDKLSKALVRHAGEEARKDVFDSTDPSRGVTGLVESISLLLDRETAEDVLTDCACHFPHEQLTDVRERYLETGSVD